MTVFAQPPLQMKTEASSILVGYAIISTSVFMSGLMVGWLAWG